MAGPSMPPLAQVATNERLNGHPAHLSEAQSDVLDEFKVMLEKEGYFTPAEGDKDASTDDATLLRFLRARKFVLEGAFAQFTNTENWRRDEKVAETYDEIDVAEFGKSQSVYPQWTGRRDRAGLPLYVFKVSELTSDVVSAYSAEPERLAPRMTALNEHMVQFALPFCSSVPHSHPETAISATTTIVDISGVSLSRFWALRAHMQRASTLATAHYAETLGTIFIVGAPGFFAIVWGWIAKWFDPHTVEKIYILQTSQVLPTLSLFIDPASIPIAFGGELDYTYGVDRPMLDSDAKERLGLDEVPRGSLRWIKGELVLKGTGRSEEEIEKCTPKPRKNDTSGEGEAPLPVLPAEAAVAE